MIQTAQTAHANAGFDMVMTSNPTYAMTGNVEGVIFTGTGNQNIVGTPVQGLYIGGAGNDTINAGGGDDTIRGGAGNDSLLGADGFCARFLSEGRRGCQTQDGREPQETQEHL